MLLADTLFFDGSGRGLERALKRVTDVDGETQTFLDETAFSAVLVGGRLEIAYDCPDLALCVAPPLLVGAETDAGITFDAALGKVPLVFASIDR